MQTFIPFDDVERSVRVLDRQRLGKQRVETLQLLHALDPEWPSKGWVHHPAAQMWAGCEGALARYGLACVREWARRGYSNEKCEPQLREYAERYPEDELPIWWGEPKVHLSHQSNLIRKDYEFYRWKFPCAPEGLPYVWPRLTVNHYVLEVGP